VKTRAKADRAIRHVNNLSRAHLLVVALVFGAIGGYILIRSFAATTEPATKIISPEDTNSYAGAFDIMATITIPNDSPLTGTGMTFKVDGARIGSEITDHTTDVQKNITVYTFTLPAWNSTTVSNGVHNLTVVGRDSGGGTSTDTYDFLIDNVKPTISLINPGSTLSGTVNLSASVSDNIGVVWVHFLLIDPNCPASSIQRNQDLPATDPNSDEGCLFLGMAEPATAAAARNGTITASWDTTKVPNGVNYTLKAIAYDGAGPTNQVISNTITNVTINNPGSTVVLGNATTPGSALYKNVYQVDDQWTCDRGDSIYDSVTVIMVDPTDKAYNGASGDAVHPGQCDNNTVKKLNIVNYFGDAIKGGGNHNVWGESSNPNSGAIRCYSRQPIKHQDGIQSLGGNDVQLYNMDVRCYTANNADFFTTTNPNGPQGLATPGATNVVCHHCNFGSGASNTVLLGNNTTHTGIDGGTWVCPGTHSTVRLATDADTAAGQWPPADPVATLDQGNPTNGYSVADPVTNPICAVPPGIFAQASDVDTSPPTVSVTAPTGGTLSGSNTLKATAADNKGVVSVQFQVDGVNVGPPRTSAPYTYSWDSATVGNGTHHLTATAWDDTSSTTSFPSVTVTTSNVGAPQAPTVNLTASPSTAATGGSTNLSWTTTNATSCTASGAWNGGRPINGSESQGPLSTTSTFTLTCTGPGGSASDSKTVTVSGGVIGDVWGSAGAPDGHINIFDLTRVLSKFGSADTICDIWGPSGVPDGAVNMFDVTYITNHYGQ
jgi:hypothetical protein